MSLTNGNRQSKPISRRKSFSTVGTADWASIEADAIRDAVAALGAIGGAIRYGYTRDGGAYAVGVYGLEAQPYTDYLRPGDDVEGYLRQLAQDARNAGPLTKQP